MSSGAGWLWLFEWFEATTLGVTVRESIWLFPVIEAVHLIGICLLGGALLVVDLRMLGLGLSRQSIGELHDELRPWLLGAVAMQLVTGSLLFLSEAVKCYYNQSFWVKMAALPLALAFTFTWRARVASRAPQTGTSTKTRLAAASSMALWFTVAAAGRWIGFS